MKNLSNPIKNFQKLFYCLFIFNLAPASVIAVERHHHTPFPFPRVTGNVANAGVYPRSINVSEKFDKVYTISPYDGNVTVIDGKDNKVVDTVFTETDPNYAAIDDKTNRLYVLSDGTSSIIKLNTKTNQVVGVPITIGKPHQPPGCNNFDKPCSDQGSDSYGISINHRTSRIYVGNLGDETISVVDAKTGQIVDTISVGVTPYQMAINEKTNKL
jgi:YVTN family beta-propeller protein